MVRIRIRLRMRQCVLKIENLEYFRFDFREKIFCQFYPKFRKTSTSAGVGDGEFLLYRQNWGIYICIEVNSTIFSDISERNNDYSDTLDFRKGRVGEVGVVTIFVLKVPDYYSWLDKLTSYSTSVVQRFHRRLWAPLVIYLRKYSGSYGKNKYFDLNVIFFEKYDVLRKNEEELSYWA